MKTLALVAPHGTFPVASVSAPVQRVIDALPIGTELECIGGNGNISNVVVDRIKGPLRVLEPLVLELPDAWVHAVGRLAWKRAHLRLDRGEDAKADLHAAMRANVPGLAADYLRLSERNRLALLAAYAEWSQAQPLTPELLAPLPIARWTDTQIRGALEWALGRDGTFGQHDAEALVSVLQKHGVDTKPFAKKLGKLKKAKSEAPPARTGTCVRIDTVLPQAKVIGGTNETIYIASSEPATTGEWRGARFVKDAATPILAVFGLDGRERTDLRRKGRAFSCVTGEYALMVEYGSTSYVAKLPDLEVLVAYPHGIRAFDSELVWGVFERHHDPPRMRSEVRTLEGKVLASFWPQDVDRVWWDADSLHVMVTLYDENGEPIDEGPDARLDRISRTSGEVLDSKPAEKYGYLREPKPAVTILSQSGEETLPRAPWSFGYWKKGDSLGIEMQWKGKDLFLKRKNEAWVSLSLSNAADSIDLAPPWLALHGPAGVVAIRVDELLTAQAIHLDGEKVVMRAKKVERPKPSKKLTEWFGLLVEHGLIESMDDLDRDQLLFSKLEDATKPDQTTLGRILEDRSPLVVSHDSHWFEEDDRIIERFNAALEGDTVRFTKDELTQGSVTVGVSTPKRKSTFSCESLIYEVAESLDAELEKHKAKKRIYTLESYQEDIHLYIVLTPGHKKRLITAGIVGINKDASPHEM